MSDLPTGYSLTEIPARLADLGFRFVHPTKWALADLPAEVPDFDKQDAFAPLAMAMAPFAAIVFSVAARPAYADGTLSQWLHWLVKTQGFDPGDIELENDLAHPAVACWGLQVSDGTPLRMRFLLLEDGGRLVVLTALAPAALWTSVHDTLRLMLRSFALVAPQGSRTRLCPPGERLPDSTFTALPPAAAQATPRPASAARPEVEVVRYADDCGDAGEHETLPVEEVANQTPAQFPNVALADDSATLRQDDPINQNLLQKGAGFAPRIVAEYPQQKCATLAAGSLTAALRVPFGWHVLDDGKRTLVHDGAGGVQIQLDRRPRGGVDHDSFLRDLLPELRKSWPDLVPRRLRISGTECLVLAGIVDSGEPLAQVYMLRDAPQDQLLVVRVTCKPDDLGRAGDCAELLLREVVFLDAANAAPIWWTEAQRLEQADQIEAAERLLLASIDHLGVCSQIAHLHELRGNRLAAAGDALGAKAAYETSGDWMDRMASGATSGGEGAALSLQRDEHRKRLGLRPYGA